MAMKKIILTLVVLLVCAAMADGQTYTTLWKQVKEAEQQDLPRTQYDILMKIVQKACREHQPGQLMKAELQGAQVMTDISPDSLLPAVERMEQRMEAENDIVLKTIYQVVLRRIYLSNEKLERTPQTIILTPALCSRLAAVKTLDYEPLLVKGVDSRYFDDDLLSVIGYELEQFQPLCDYYKKAGNRKAAFLTGLRSLVEQQPDMYNVDLKKSDYLQRLDSLISEYQDLPECGEAAIKRYNYMDVCTNATAEEKWQYINLALDRWGSWKAMNRLRNNLKALTQPVFDCYIENIMNIPNREALLKLDRIRNIKQLTMHVYSVKAQGNTELNVNTEEGYRKVKPLLTLLPFDEVRRYVGKKEYEFFEDSIMLRGLPEGVYMIELEGDHSSTVSRELYYVSDVRLLAEGQPGDVVRYAVVNATTGQPLKGAYVELSDGNKVLATLTTDNRGETLWEIKESERTPRRVFAYTDADKFCRADYNNAYFQYRKNERHIERVQVFTDRIIYRPGQNVHAAAIAYAIDNGVEQKAQEGRQLTLTLRDANNKAVSEQKVVTDRFGTCSADFTLPVGLQTGRFSLDTPYGGCSFSVEEYKRPTFEVKFPEVNQPYENGDTVQVRATARSYAGVPVQGAKVHYTVVRRRSLWWLSQRHNGVFVAKSPDNEEIASGETTSDDNGTFVVDVPMVMPSSPHPQFYNFLCVAEVTDRAGETHQAELSLPLGNRKTAFTCDMDNTIIVEESPEMTFRLRNAAGIDIDAAVRYRFDHGKWLTAPTQTTVPVAQMKVGKHTLEAICEQDTLKHDFVIFSLNDKRPAIETNDWFYQSAAQFPADGTPITIQVGSSAKNVHILYSIFSGDKVLESGAVDKSNELINRKLTYREEYGDGVLLTFAWMKQGVVYSHTMSITRPQPDKKLKLEWQTFRDRLTPGQQEEWRLTVKGPDGKPADAQLMATLYDKSLDQLLDNDWFFSVFNPISLPHTSWSYYYGGRGWLGGYKTYSSLKVQELSLTAFDYAIFPHMARLLYNTRLASVHKVSSIGSLSNSDFESETVVQPVSYSDKLGAGSSIQKKRLQGRGIEKASAFESVQIRENLQETAFFYPQLLTDDAGGVSLKFTLPESLTTWRFIGLAHTPDLCYGKLEGEVVAQKDVMIQPNVPRFVREGDQATVSARIFNLSSKTVNGTARMQLVNPETDEVAYDTVQRIMLKPDSTADVSFRLSPLTEQLLICRVTVSGQGFSDGEQHYLPVLPATERVTVTVPFTQNVPGTKTVDLTKLFPQIQNIPNNQIIPNTQNSPKLTIEYTNNPAWLMILALPAVGHPLDDCAACQVASLYANSLGKHIISQVPQAKQVFEQWKREDGKETSLSSQLSKNQELKDLLLEETSWVTDADHEQQQRRQLADFFDENMITQRIASATDKLKTLQREDGSWSWWPDMPGSTNMTMAISETLVRLNEMTGGKQPMLDGAFKFLGKEMVKLVQEMKEQEKKGHRQSFPGHNALQWLYICKLDGRQLPVQVQQANNYLIALLKKGSKNQSIYEKAMSSIILESPLYIKSLKEYSVYQEEMGRYYDTPRAGYSWRDYRIPTQVAAIEAIERLAPRSSDGSLQNKNDQQMLDEMRRWLLQQKRTQAWDTPLNSIDAVYAFLSEKGFVNSDKLLANTPTALKLDGKLVETPKTTTGTGYVKVAQSYHGEKNFTAEKTSRGTSWGAVYAQFVQATNDVKDNASGISIRRELLGRDLQPFATPHALLKVGDRVTVRLTIQSERDYDFVQVQDKRAACLEPVKQLSGFNWQGGYYCSPRDNTTNFFFDRLSKGKHVIETEYYIDRTGQYETGTCTVQCAYAPEFRGITHSQTIKVE